MKYILLHAALAKVLRDSDMGRWVDGTLREVINILSIHPLRLMNFPQLERMEGLASDGSHADVLASSLHATGLASGGASALGTPNNGTMEMWPQ